jgi:L-rhamnose mutarotase
MKRVALKMKLNQGQTAEYKRRHDELWPELEALLKATTISDYAIFLDEETHILFANLKIENEDLLAALPQNPIIKRWWAYMADIMETNEDNSPKAMDLKEVFYLE